MRLLTETGPIDLTADGLLVNTVFEGDSGFGKTVAALDAATTVLRERRDIGFVTIDGGQTFSEKLWMEHCLSATPATRDRVRYVRFDDLNSSEFAIDLTRLQPGETVLERVQEIIASVSHQRADAEMFALIAASAACALACLVAGRRPITELNLLTWNVNGYYWKWLKEQISANPEANWKSREYVERSVLYVDALLKTKDAKNEGTDVVTQDMRFIDTFFGSTYRIFHPFTHTLSSYFYRPTYDFHAAMRAGQRLLLDFRLTDDRVSAFMKRTFYGLCATHSLRYRTPMLTVVDEQHGFDARTYMGALASSRNRNWASWFLYQSPDQIGEDGSHYQTLRSIARNVFAFRPCTPAHARILAQLKRTIHRTETIIPVYSSSSTEGETWNETHGRSKTVTESTGVSFGEPPELPPVEEHRIERFTESGKTSEIVRKSPTENHGLRDRTSFNNSSALAVAESASATRGGTRGRSTTVQQARLSYAERLDIETEIVGGLDIGQCLFAREQHETVTARTTFWDPEDEEDYLSDRARELRFAQASDAVRPNADVWKPTPPPIPQPGPTTEPPPPDPPTSRFRRRGA